MKRTKPFLGLLDCLIYIAFGKPEKKPAPPKMVAGPGDHSKLEVARMVLEGVESKKKTKIKWAVPITLVTITGLFAFVFIYH